MCVYLSLNFSFWFYLTCVLIFLCGRKRTLLCLILVRVCDSGTPNPAAASWTPPTYNNPSFAPEQNLYGGGQPLYGTPHGLKSFQHNQQQTPPKPSHVFSPNLNPSANHFTPSTPSVLSPLAPSATPSTLNPQVQSPPSQAVESQQKVQVSESQIEQTPVALVETSNNQAPTGPSVAESLASEVSLPSKQEFVSSDEMVMSESKGSEPLLPTPVTEASSSDTVSKEVEKSVTALSSSVLIEEDLRASTNDTRNALLPTPPLISRSPSGSRPTTPRSTDSDKEASSEADDEGDGAPSRRIYSQDFMRSLRNVCFDISSISSTHID